ncbi:uncharacterized protein LOC110466660 [Mizuhopecten yessoensis]|uniref:uncharacterized protein LOC110466660 n=1 Tax=Mizuhopecten yessoensis TaxID=6573 RepID=UPI000B45F374|nr:uncharacterized protein LOC110466660 [Mizuhopecten yessoensis]XP_021379005.1 uncharacterized protein LOC110466660 [Mizuhopecten yessoensis]
MAKPITFIPTTSTKFGTSTTHGGTTTNTEPVTSITTQADSSSVFGGFVYIVIAVVATAVILSILVVHVRRISRERALRKARKRAISFQARSSDIPKSTCTVQKTIGDLHYETDDIRLHIKGDDKYEGIYDKKKCSIILDHNLYKNENNRDMFGRSWDFRKPLSSLKDQIHINETGVSVAFSKNSNQYEQELKFNVYCSIHENFKVLASKLNIKNYQMLVSPVAELALSYKTHLHGHVILELPLCKFETFSSLGVHWISTPLTTFATVKDIPYEKDPTSSSLDCFYTLSDSGTVRVYTNHFSLFFCTCCKSDIRFELLAQTCARVGVIDGYPTLQIKLFFQGLQNRLKKREENENELDKKKGFNVIEGGEIHLLKKPNSKTKSGFLKCRLSTLMEERCPKWEHIKRGEDQCPIYQPEQVVDVAELIRCWHKDHELCYCINWYLKCEKRYCHRLPIVIDVENTRHLTKSDKKIQTTFTMEVDINTGLNRFQDPIRNLIDSLGHDKMRRLLDVLELRSIQERGRVEDEKEQWYETLSAVRTDPNVSLRLGNAMATVGVELCDQNIIGLINAESGHENQRVARNELEHSYDCPETISTGSGYAKVNSHFATNIRNPESTYLSLNSVANDSVRSRRSQLQPPRHKTVFLESSTSSYALTSTSGHAHDEGATARPIIYSESKDKQNHVIADRPSPIGGYNDSDGTNRKEIIDSDSDETNRKEIVDSDSGGTHRKEIVDSGQTYTKSTVSLGVTQPETMEEFSGWWV